jgi:hypothetical protein
MTREVKLSKPLSIRLTFANKEYLKGKIASHVINEIIEQKRLKDLEKMKGEDEWRELILKDIK